MSSRPPNAAASPPRAPPAPPAAACLDGGSSSFLHLPAPSVRPAARPTAPTVVACKPPWPWPAVLPPLSPLRVAAAGTSSCGSAGPSESITSSMHPRRTYRLTPVCPSLVMRCRTRSSQPGPSCSGSASWIFSRCVTGLGVGQAGREGRMRGCTQADPLPVAAAPRIARAAVRCTEHVARTCKRVGRLRT